MESVVRKLDRMAVRTLAEKNSAELVAIANAGGNTYQKSLEHQDKVDEFAATLTPEDAVAFMNMYAEELNACTQKMLDDTTVNLAKAQAANHTTEAAAGGFIWLFVLLFILFMVFK